MPETTYDQTDLEISGKCPHCGAQIMDPFGLGIPIHDVPACAGVVIYDYSTGDDSEAASTR